MWTTCVPDSQGGQKKASGPLKLMSDMAVIHHVGAKNCIPVRCRSSGCSSATGVEHLPVTYSKPLTSYTSLY